MRGQLQLGIILTIGGAVGGSVMWVYNLISPVKDAVASDERDIAVLQEVVKCIPSMQAEIKNTNDNVIKLLERQGVTPIKRLATTTTYD